MILPEYWLQNRILILGGAIILLIFYFYSALRNYKTLINLYKKTDTSSVKPPISVQIANYIFLQNKSSCFTLWLIQCCQSGLITLHYDKGGAPWSISQNSGAFKTSEQDKALLSQLFIRNNTISLDSSFSEPVSEVLEASNHLYDAVKEKNRSFMQRKMSSFLAWIILGGLFIELFFLSSLYSTPGLIVICFALTISTGFFIYSLIYLLQGLFNGKHILSLIMLMVPFLIMIGLHWGLTGINNGGFYFPTCFYPDVMISIALIIYLAPRVPKEPFLLQQIVAYQKYLQSESSVIEQELSWRIGLEVSPSVFGDHWIYKDQIPDWIKSNESDKQYLMEALHTSFPANINTSINGRVKVKHKSTIRHNKRL